MYVRVELANGCYFLLAVDNLDWAAMRTALHQYECSKGDQGRHILNRMVFALKTTPEIRALPDEWGLWKNVTLEDIIVSTAAEDASTLVRGKWLPVGLGQGRPGKATNLIELVRRGVEPAADTEAAPGTTASDARPPGATPAPGCAGGAAAASPATQVAAAGPGRTGLRRRRAATPQATPAPRGRTPTPRRTSKRSKSSSAKAS